MQLIIPLLIAVVALAIGFIAGNNVIKKKIESELGSTKIRAKAIIDEATRTAEAEKKELLLSAKEENIKAKNELDKEIRERRNELQKLEKRNIQREETLEKKMDTLEKKEEAIATKSQLLDTKTEELSTIIEKQHSELERISGYTSAEAKEQLLKTLESEIRIEMSVLIKTLEAEAKEEADKRATEIVAQAIGRCAVDHVAESTVSVVSLPSDEMKGRIIGREGRNIRTIESLTGIELIIDDTPEAVILSGFDAMRREIAKIALEKLIVDGRVHPARIEEMVDKARKEVEAQMKADGESAAFEVGVHGLNNDLIRLIGKMKFRTSYGQNILKHSIEVAHLSGLMAAELGLDVSLAKRAGLLHDIGKSIDQDMEGSHVALGVNLLKKYKESPIVINAVEAHHGDVEPTSIIAVLVQAADAISAARPGARRETLELYIKRLETLEGIADSFKGVEKSFAIQAGRELRVVIIPEEVKDEEMTILAREIAKRVENELEYPGQIKINLVRESRALEYAK